MRRTVPLAAVTTLLAAVLSACGTTEDPDAAGKSSSDEKITITDARGKKVTLDGPAERVAGTEWNVNEYLISLGVQPVGVSDIKGYNTWVSSEKLGGQAKDIGTRGEPSLDTLATLDLDLVLVTDALVDGAIEQIEKTTPVIVVPGGNSKDAIGQMFTNLDLVARATGTEDEAADLRADFDKKVADGKAAVEAAGATGDKVAFSDAYDTGGGSISIRPFAEGSLISDVLAEIGLDNGWGGLKGDEVYGLAETDVEGLTKLEDDVRFWYIANDSESADPYADVLAKNAVWKSLPFVKNDATTRIPDKIWMFGGPTSMAQVIDAAVDALK